MRLFFYTNETHKEFEILNALLLSRIGALSVPKLYFDSAYINKTTSITSLTVSTVVDDYSFINSKTRDLFCKSFLNLEQLNVKLRNQDDLLFILTQLPKLSIIGYFYVIGTFPENQYQWLKENTSKLNMNFLFQMDDTIFRTDIKYSINQYKRSNIWIDRTYNL